ncbi:hypothetical protein D3C75_585950 [compost metagenome]
MGQIFVFGEHKCKQRECRVCCIRCQEQDHSGDALNEEVQTAAAKSRLSNLRNYCCFFIRHYTVPVGQQCNSCKHNTEDKPHQHQGFCGIFFRWRFEVRDGIRYRFYPGQGRTAGAKCLKQQEKTDVRYSRPDFRHIGMSAAGHIFEYS